MRPLKRAFTRWWFISLVWWPALNEAASASLAADPSANDALIFAVTQHPERLDNLLDALDLTLPELTAVARAIDADQPAGALAALLVHFGQRPPPSSSWLPPLPRYGGAVERADAVMNDRFLIQGRTGRQPRRDDGGLDWDARGPEDDPEWAWLLNRHAYFEDLVTAYQETGDTRYIERLSSDLSDWVLSNPYPGRLTFSAAWRPLEVARRILNSWTHIFFALQDEPAFSAEARLLLLSSLPHHADALAHHHSFWGGNHLITETTALATIASAWPEFTQASDWRDIATTRFHGEIMAQTYPDGAFLELSNHYHKIVWQSLERFCALLETSEHDDPALEQDLRSRRADMRRYFEGVARPDGKGPLNNASDREDNLWHLEQAGAERVFPSTPLPDGGESPSLYFPWAGHAVMRDAWENGNEWAFFDIGPYGSGHQHRDTLHLSVWFDQRLFLADSGRFTYQPGPWTAYFKGPRAHNTVLLNGEAPLPGPRSVSRPIANPAVIERDFAWFAGRAAYPVSLTRGSGPAVHERAVIYLPAIGWLIVDVVNATGTHALETIWNFGPAVTEAEAIQHLRLVAARDATGPILPRERFLQGEESPIAGWYSEQFGQKVPALERQAHFKIRGRTVMIWSIPIRPETTVSATTIDTTRANITFESGEDQRQVRLRFSPSGVAVEVDPIAAP